MLTVTRRGNSDILSFENVRIVHKNFSGRPSEYNRAGDRNFSVVLTEDEAVALREAGWNAKIRVNPDDHSDVFCYMNVTVRYDNYPPRIYRIVGDRAILMTEDTVGSIDGSEITNVDLVISGSKWAKAGFSGVKAYVRDMYITVEEDAFSAKYADIIH